MIIELGTEKDIESWMNLVEKVNDAFPGLETKEGSERKLRALCFSRDASIFGGN